jgi:cobalt-precorrin 5A hydrolase
VIVAGFGFRAAAPVESLLDAFEGARKRVARGVEAGAISGPADKCAAPVFRALAAHTGLPVIAVADDDLAAQDTWTKSHASRASRGTGSVAEAAALAAAGPGARLLGARQVSGDRLATCALAEGRET